MRNITHPSRRLKHFFIESTLAEGRELPAPAPLQHRLKDVLRLSEGTEVALFNGQQGLWRAQVGPKGKTLVVNDIIVAHPPAPPPTTLALCLPKREAWESALRQATELNVGAIQPLMSQFSQREKFNPSRAATLVIEAAEQCERLTLPQVHAPQPFETWLQSQTAPLAWAYERQQPDHVATQPRQPAHTVLIGPEGGFSPDEVAQLEAHRWVYNMSLGPTILRTDTAVVAALAALGGRS